MGVSDLLYEMVYNTTEETEEHTKVLDKIVALIEHLEYSIEDIKSFDELTPKEKEILEPLKEFFI